MTTKQDKQRKQWRAENIHLQTGDVFNAQQELHGLFEEYGIEKIGISAADYSENADKGYQQAQDLLRSLDTAGIFGLLFGLSEAMYELFYTDVDA